MRELLSRINFPKTIAVLAVTLVVGLGACGVTVISPSHSIAGSGFIIVAEIAAIVLSVVGLVITFILWIVALIMGVS